MVEQSFELRPFHTADLETMQHIRKAAFTPVFLSFREILGETIYALALNDADDEQADLLTSLCKPEAKDRVFVAVIDGLVVGFVTFTLNPEKRIGEIGLNAVHPDHAGKGVGTALYEFAVEVMRRAGMRLAAVGTGGDPSHIPAQRAYRKAGFDTCVPSLWMYKVL